MAILETQNIQRKLLRNMQKTTTYSKPKDF